MVNNLTQQTDNVVGQVYVSKTKFSNV